jgi:hypothetical protein
MTALNDGKQRYLQGIRFIPLANQWYEEKRNVYQDLIDTLGDKGSAEANLDAYQYIDIVAIMTDTDNSETDAESYYGDLVFTAQ